MRIKIDLQLCQGHGLCQEEAPEVFRVVEVPGAYDHVELIMTSPDESLREKVEAAVRFCPNRVLSLED
jgi:ferredoxin